MIRYFTALITGPRRLNQQTFLRAIETLPLVEVILGTFKRKRVRCAYSGCTLTAPPNRFFEAHEEKRTDVNIAVYMLDDAYQNRCDNFVLISGDSDWSTNREYAAALDAFDPTVFRRQYPELFAPEGESATDVSR